MMGTETAGVRRTITTRDARGFERTIAITPDDDDPKRHVGPGETLVRELFSYVDEDEADRPSRFDSPSSYFATRDDVADRLREALALAREAAEFHRIANPKLGRQASLVATHTEEALLVCLYGNRL